MTEDKLTYPYPSTTVEEIRAAAECLGLPISDGEIIRTHKEVLSLEGSAARLRQGLHRNDEPAFGFRHPAGER